MPYSRSDSDFDDGDTPQGRDKWSGAASASQAGSHQRDDDSPEWLQAETRRVQGDSLASTRRALARIGDTEARAQGGLALAGRQSEQLRSVEARLAAAEHHAKIDEARAARLSAVSRFFMLPALGAARARRREDRLRRHPPAAPAAPRELPDSLCRDPPTHHGPSSSPSNIKSAKSDPGARASPAHRDFHTTPSGIVRSDTEVELDHNLGQISSGLARLKMMGSAMNDELSMQHSQLARIQHRTDATRSRVANLNHKVERISGGSRPSH